MSRRVKGWLAIAATVVLLPILKWSHIGVLHYNAFLIILLGWTLGLMFWFRWMGPDEGLEIDPQIGREDLEDD